MSSRNFDRFSTNQQAQRIFASDSARGSTSEERLARIMSRELDSDRRHTNREARQIFQSDGRSSTTVVMGGHPVMGMPMMAHPMMAHHMVPHGVAISTLPVSTSSGHVVIGGHLPVGPALTLIGPNGLTVVSPTPTVVVQNSTTSSSGSSSGTGNKSSSSGVYIINGIVYRR
jgi:hypothetical protein